MGGWGDFNIKVGGDTRGQKAKRFERLKRTSQENVHHNPAQHQAWNWQVRSPSTVESLRGNLHPRSAIAFITRPAASSVSLSGE